MKTIAFLGSPRKDGNTELLLTEAIRGVPGTAGGEVAVFNLNLMDIKPCQDCGGCEKTGECVLEDDMAKIYPEIRSADRIILASPIFFFGLSAQSKTMIDRCQSFWCEKYLLKKPIPPGEFGRKGLLIVVGGMKKEVGVECGDACAKAFFRTINVGEHKALSFLGVDAKGAIRDHPTGLKDAFEAGRTLAGR
jgi:multimeric flavodoxin WrbA